MTRRDHWDEDSGYPVKDWKAEVANDDTRLGYRDWVDARSEMLASEDSPSTAKLAPRRDAVRIRATDRIGNIAYIHREANRPMRCTLANGVAAALFYAGITVDEMTCRFVLNDCETADQALAIVRRYGSLDYGYCHAGPPPGWDSAPATPPALHLLAGLLGQIDRLATIMPEAVGQIDEDAVKRARAFIAMELPQGSREA
ncbi:hypothetical protein ACFSUK_04495 [Sphingobium scionense]|jgi:hypothetical protein|uniref:Uncharacterized protein n=1 Tax=Sphingobium scionense TaxID=1404341 RepID=A0A7W6PX50_9SPHN|nr:hypothetical protein [Sphingobium scionense]MBB4150538.1 hypothetical protein [Sphingobium scionense]